MIVDFHIHYAPEKIVKEKLGDQPFKLIYTDGIPSYSYHPRLYQIEQMAKSLEVAGIDRAYVSCAAGMGTDLEVCKYINDDLAQWEKRFPSMIKGLAHTNPLDSKDGFAEIDRAVNELGFEGMAIASNVDGRELDSEELFPFYEKIEKMGIFLFIHPCLAVPAVGSFNDFDLARAVGREFNLVMGTIRLINGGVIERFPNLKVIMSHLGGGISSLMGRVRKYQDKAFWGTAGDPRHGKIPPKPFDYYFEKIFFDTGGFVGEVKAVKAALLEMKPGQVVFGSDYPQEIRTPEDMKAFTDGIKKDISPEVATQILSGNVKKLIK